MKKNYFENKCIYDYQNLVSWRRVWRHMKQCRQSADIFTHIKEENVFAL